MINQLSLLRNRSKSLVVISCQCVHKSLKSSRVPGGFSRRLIYELKIRVSNYRNYLYPTLEKVSDHDTKSRAFAMRLRGVSPEKILSIRDPTRRV